MDYEIIRLLTNNRSFTHKFSRVSNRAIRNTIHFLKENCCIIGISHFFLK